MRLANAMEEVFMSQHAVGTSLVADVYQYVYKSTGRSQRVCHYCKRETTLVYLGLPHLTPNSGQTTMAN